MIKMPQYAIILRRRESEHLTLNDLAAHANVHPELISKFVKFGLITPVEKIEDRLLFDPAAIHRVLTIIRLRQSLSINLSGISVVLDLLDKLTSFQRENERLRRDG